MKTKATYQLFLYFLVILFFFVAKNTYSQTAMELKAAYLVNLTKFVDVKGTISFGVWRDNDIVPTLENMMQETLTKERHEPVVVFEDDYTKLLKAIETGKINYLFIGNVKDVVELRKIIDLANKTKGILTIGNNIEYFCENGGMINFTDPSASKRLQINRNEAKEAGIEIRIQLLNISELISTQR